MPLLSNGAADFIAHNSLRFVKPYFSSHVVTTKARHIGKTLAAAYAEEFFAPADIVRRMCALNHLRLWTPSHSTNNPNAVIESRNSFMKCATMWTEIPVPASVHLKIQDAGRDQPHSLAHERVLIHKPCGIAVHENAHFRKNTMMHYLRQGIFQSAHSPSDEFAVRARTQLFMNNRLDRVTSGLIICSLSNHDVQFMTRQFMNKRIFKLYLSKVRGKAFGSDSLQQLANTRKDGQVVHCWAPLLEVEENRGLWTAVEKKPSFEAQANNGDHIVLWNSKTEDGLELRECYSMFIPLHYDEALDETVVLCCPVSGKSRQLREHLKYLGHSIIGDEITAVEEAVRSRVNPFAIRWQALDGYSLDLEIDSTQEQAPRDWQRAKELLLEYQLSRADQYLEKQFEICLHSYRYEHEEFFKYSADIPQWASGVISAQDIDEAAEELKKQRPLIKKAPKKRPRGQANA